MTKRVYEAAVAVAAAETTKSTASRYRQSRTLLLALRGSMKRLRAEHLSPALVLLLFNTASVED